jgi:hypothetical protein
VSAGSRKEALEKLAEEHCVSLAANTSAAEDLAEALGAPEKIKKWCAVTEHDGVTYLYPDCDSAEEAKSRAEQHEGDTTFHETAVAVVDLDTGEQYSAEVGLVAWHKERTEEVAPDVRALRLLQARGNKDWRVRLADTGGGMAVCEVERIGSEDDEAATYAWVAGSEGENPDDFLVCLYTRKCWEEPFSSKEVSAAELAGYVFAELEGAEKGEGK